MRFRVLGEVEVERDGDAVVLGGPQQRRLLALLLSERGRVVSIERIVEALWADGGSPDAASRSAMKYVSRLRAMVGENVIATVGAGYRLELNGHGCDVEEFEVLIGAAGRDMPDAAVARYDAALQLWRGPATASSATSGGRCRTRCGSLSCGSRPSSPGRRRRWRWAITIGRSLTWSA